MRYTRAIAVVGLCCGICITNILGGCATAPPYRRETYVVRPQDTLYSIAWRHDVDFRDLAKWNNIGPDYRLSVGQVLLLQPERGSSDRHAAAGPSAATSHAAGTNTGAAGTGTPGASQPAGRGPASGAVPSAIAQPPTASRSQSLPRVGKPKPLPDAPGGAQHVAPAGGLADGAANAAGLGTGSGPGVAAGTDAVTARGAAAPEVSAGAGGAARAATAGGATKWLWPTEHSAPPRPVPGGGILLFGKLGQDVRAAGAGRVVYTGSGIRGYGNLIIVKHGDNLLSSYAHNSEMLVHEGQDVFVGQIIAHMGTAAHQTSALYFEIRLNGKPVDPLRYLPGTQ